MTSPVRSLTAAACAVLQTADASEKATLTRRLALAWRRGTLNGIGHSRPPDRPARPARPALQPPSEMTKRRKGRTPAARVALLHALAHIELNAIDMAWDLIARFGSRSLTVALPRKFFDDWVGVADDEARHFQMLVGRLAAFGARYGDLPAHDALWDAAAATADDLLARLAIVPMVLEARGLDVTPAMISRLRDYGDDASAAVLQIIYNDEIGHVGTGSRWFVALCRQQGKDARDTWQALVTRYFKGNLKPPFNEVGRRAAGLEPSFYRDLVS